MVKKLKNERSPNTVYSSASLRHAIAPVVFHYVNQVKWQNSERKTQPRLTSDFSNPDAFYCSQQCNIKNLKKTEDKKSCPNAKVISNSVAHPPNVTVNVTQCRARHFSCATGRERELCGSQQKSLSLSKKIIQVLPSCQIAPSQNKLRIDKPVPEKSGKAHWEFPSSNEITINHQAEEISSMDDQILTGVSTRYVLRNAMAKCTLKKTLLICQASFPPDILYGWVSECWECWTLCNMTEVSKLTGCGVLALSNRSSLCSALGEGNAKVAQVTRKEKALKNTHVAPQNAVRLEIRRPVNPDRISRQDPPVSQSPTYPSSSSLVKNTLAFSF